MSTFEKAFSAKVIQWRLPIIFFSILLVLLAANGVKELTFTNNYRVFFSDNNPQLKAFEALENTYSKNDNVMIVLAPKDGKVFTPKTLSVVEEITREAWQIPYSNRVDSITNFQHTEAEGDDLVVQDLVTNASTLTPKEIERIKQISLHEPLLIDRLISIEEHVTAINVIIQLPNIDETSETPEVVNFVRNMAKDIHTNHPDIDVYLSGMIMMNNAFSEATQNDLKTLIPISFGLMLLILALMVGGLSGTLVTLLVIAFSIISAMGLGARIGYPLTPPSASAPTIILTVAIANCVHILATFFYQMRIGVNKKEALQESVRVNLQPIFLASLTTALGFLALNFSDVPPFRHLGNFVAIGVAMALFLSVTFLPALLSLLPIRVKKTQNINKDSMTRFSEFVIANRSRILWGTSIIVVLLVSAIPRNELNDIFVNYFDPSVSFRADSDFITDNLTGVYSIDYSVESGQSGGISDPKFQQELEKFAQWYRQQPEVTHVNTFTEIMTRLNKNMHNDEPAWYKLPNHRELAAQYLLLYEMSLPYGLDLNNQVNVDKSATRLIVNLKTLSTNEILALEQRVQNWLSENTTSIRSAIGTGTTLMFAHIGQRNIISMLIGTSLALFLISIVLIAALRSFKIGLISLIPNLIPAAIGFGLWGLIVGEVGIGLSIVMSMTLGIVVDDTVHFLSKYLRARRENNMSSKDAVRYAFKTVGRALFTTTVILVSGFLVLAMSSFQMNAGMGLLTAIIISFALIVDFLLLPAILMKVEEKKDVQMVSANATTDRIAG